jgi:hypothetical protein
MLERAFRQRVDERPNAFRDASQDGVRERHRPLEPGAPNELDRLVHGRVARDPVEIAELVRPEPQGGQHGRVELSHRTLAERLDRVIERPHPLDRSEGEPPRQRDVAVLEPLRGGAQSPVGVRVVLEDPAQHLVGRSPSRRNGQRSPRTNSS